MSPPAEDNNGKNKSKKGPGRRKKKGTYGLTQPEDKEPHRSLSGVETPESSSGRAQVLPKEMASQQPSSTATAIESTSAAKGEPTPGSPGEPPADDKPTVVPPNVSWEEVGQFALNSSILSGTFEDVKILACSRRSQTSAVVCGARPLHVNSALIRKALTNAHLLLDTVDALSDVFEHADVRDIEASFHTCDYDYLEDSDLEDGEIITLEAESEEEVEDDAEAQVINSVTSEDAHGTTSLVGIFEPTGEKLRCTTSETPGVDVHEEVDKTLIELGPGFAPAQDSRTPPIDDAGHLPEDNPKASEQDDHPEVPQLSKVNSMGPRKAALPRSGPRTVLVPDLAFQTLRTFIFYAYTGRVAFAPLRSQGMIYQDAGKDASQLPICSPKSMYRLAVKYGSEPLRTQAGTDVQSKLSTQNILDELSSRFTSRYPEIQDMELNFLLAHIQHPDITVRLPHWIDRFARGQLAASADTFGMLIHKLACRAAPPNSFTGGPFPPSFCPRGCLMPTIRTQFRCSTCGYIMT